MCPRRVRRADRGGHVNGVVDRSLVLRASDLPPEAVGELKREFSKSNPKFYKLEAMGKWTGNTPKTIRGWGVEDGLLYLPRGAIAVVDEMLGYHGVKVGWRDDTVRRPQIAPKLSFEGTLRPYQEEAVEALTGALNGSQGHVSGSGWPDLPNGVLRGPPGSGKSVLAIGVIVARNRPALIVVHSTALLQQWREACARFLGFEPGTIQGNKADVRPVTVAMQQTLWRRMGKRPPGYVREFEIVLIDECHRVASKTYNAVAELFPGAQRIGVSADERRKDGMEFLTEWTVGPLLHEIPQDYLVEIGRLVPIEMTVVETGYVDEVWLDSTAEDDNPDWVGMIGRLTRDMRRNEVIVGRVVRLLKEEPGARVLVLTERVEHVDMLHGQLFLHSVKVGKMLGGADNRKELERTKRGLQAGRLQVGVGTKVADEGLDIPALTDVFLTCPVHNHDKRIKQMVGRAARPSKDKKVGRATYFWDRGMFPPQPMRDPQRAKGERNFIRKLEKGIGPTGTVVVED